MEDLLQRLGCEDLEQMKELMLNKSDVDGTEETRETKSVSSYLIVIRNVNQFFYSLQAISKKLFSTVSHKSHYISCVWYIVQGDAYKSLIGLTHSG